jgi:hypothetical protein
LFFEETWETVRCKDALLRTDFHHESLAKLRPKPFFGPQRKANEKEIEDVNLKKIREKLWKSISAPMEIFEPKSCTTQFTSKLFSNGD